MSSRTTGIAEENYTVENSALNRKLQSNIEAMGILRKELDKFRTERDQFKLMAETLQIRYTAMKKSLQSSPYGDDHIPDSYSSSSRLLDEMRETNMKMATELQRTKSKLHDTEGDIEVLREEKRSLVARLETPDTSAATSSLQEDERRRFISQMEVLKKCNSQLKFDLHSLVEDKRELISEMEAYKAKALRLQADLDVTSKGNLQESAMEIDNLHKENQRLRNCIANMEKDLEMSREIIIKYKKYVETQRNGPKNPEMGPAEILKELG